MSRRRKTKGEVVIPRERKGRESNPQGSSLGRFRDGCRRHWLALSVLSCGGRNRTCNRLLNREPPYRSATPQSRVRIRSRSQESGVRNQKTGTVDLNPPFLFPKSLIPWISNVLMQEHPAGVEPARPAWRAGRLLFHHGCKWDPRNWTPPPWLRARYAAANTSIPVLSRAPRSPTHTPYRLKGGYAAITPRPRGRIGGLGFSGYRRIISLFSW